MVFLKTDRGGDYMRSENYKSGNDEKSEEIRLQKYLAQCNVASRRAAEKMITDGRVRVNGDVVTVLGTKVSPGDIVEVDGSPVYEEKKKVYIMLNKPVGYVTTVSDDEGRSTVMELVDDIPQRLYPVGRLDINTEGLLLLTNDGDFMQKVTHPRNEKKKVYQAVISGIPDHYEIEKLERGVYIDGRKTSPAKAELISAQDGKALVELTIHEGRNRQVRKMFEAIGYRVVYLRRLAVGNVILGNLPLGKWRRLNPNEVAYLMKN